MIPVSLQLQNFMSYGEDVAPLDFSQFSVACLTGQNGHGKSALLDAITWVLWGEARKAVGARKPDEGLLRLGSEEMRVELVFDLEGERFRVTRSWRKQGKTGRPSLELAIWQPEQSEYRALTGSTIGETQQKINQILRMDYDTFVNSAFLLQGRANEFTRRNASERKQILGEILGLGKYAELAALAKRHQGELRDAVLAREGEMQALAQQLAADSLWQERLQESSLQAEQLQSEVTALEVEQGRLQQAWTELQSLSARHVGLSRQLAERSAAAEDQQRQMAALEREAATDQAMIERQAVIREEYSRWQAASEQLAACGRRLQRARQLEQVASELTQQVAAAKLTLQKDLQSTTERDGRLLAELQQVELVLAKRPEVLSGYAQLLELEEQEALFEQRRQQWLRLTQRQSDLALQVEQAKAELQANVLAYSRQVQEAERRLSAIPAREQERAELEDRLKELQAVATALEQTREEGNNCNLELQRLTGESERVALAIREQGEKLALLQVAEGAACPLCEQSLDEVRQRALVERLAQEGIGLAQRQEQLVGERQRLVKQRELLRSRYQDLTNQSKQLPQIQQGLSQLGAELEQLSRLGSEAAELRQERAQLLRRLEEDDYAPAARAELKALAREMAQLAYSPEQHQMLRESLRAAAAWRLQRHDLQAAEQRHTTLLAGRAELAELIAVQSAALASESYAQSERQQLSIVQAELTAVGYDAAEHRRLEDVCRQLATSNDAYRQLMVALEKWGSLRQQLEQRQEQLLMEQRGVALLQSELTELSQQLQALPAQRALLEENDRELRSKRSSLQQAIAEQAEAKSNVERGAAARSRQSELQRELQELRALRTVYEQLAVAFGKDGIPALIIENAIPEIEALANEVLARLSDGRVYVSFESLRDKKSGGTKETLDIRISDEMGTRDYELYSGGEAFRTDFAIRIALAKLLAERAGTRLQTLVIDEGFGTQDSEGLAHMVEAIQAISNDFEKIIVVTHLEALQDAFPVRIEVSKDPDTGSHLRVVQL